MRIRSQPLIFALVAICQSFFTASYNIDFNNPCWVARDDHVDYDPCDLYDMSNDELADICESIGYQHRPNPPRDILIIGAKLCLVIDIDQMNASDDDWQREATREAMFGMIDQSIHYDQGHNNKDRELCKNSDSCIEDDVQRLILEYHVMLRDPSFISRTKRDRISYLFHKDGINDQGTHMMYRYMFNLRLKEYEDEMDMKWCEKVEDLDNTLCRFEDLKDSVLIDICERIGYHHKPNPTRDQMVRIARDYCFPYTTIQETIDNESIKLSMLTDLLGDLQDAQNHIPTVVCNTAEDINHPICTYDDLKDDVLIGICKKVGYDHNPNPTRARLVLAAAMCFAGNQVSLDDKAKVLLLDIVHETVERNSLVQFLYKSHLDMMKDASFIGMSRYDKITYILSYHGIDDMQEKANMWKLLPEKLEEEELYLTLGIDTKVKEQWIERYIPTPKEIAKLPDWYSYKPVIKGEAIKIKLFQKDGKVVISQWSKESQTWSNPRAISESNHYNNRLFVDLMKKSMQYEHVLLFQGTYDGEEYGRLLTKQTLVIGFNYGDYPLDTAIRVLDEYKLRDRDDQNKTGLHLMTITEFLRKYVSDISSKQRVNDKFRVTFVLVCILLGMYLVYSLLLPQRKKRKKPARKKISQGPITKKTIYVKLSATMRLNGNQGRKIEGLISKSGVEDIELERKTDQPTVMNKIEASNGVVYVPVHIKGSEEAVQKAVLLIQQAIGKENVDKEIKLPPTRTTQRVSTATAQIPKGRKTTSSRPSACIRSCQSPKTIVTNLYQNARSTIKSLSWPSVAVISITVLYVILLCITYLNLDCMLLGLDTTHPYCSSDRYCTIGLKRKDVLCKPGQIHRAALVSFVWVLVSLVWFSGLLFLWPIARGIKQMQLSKAEIAIFVSLCCVTLFVMEDPCKDRDGNSCEQWLASLMILLFLGVMVILWKRLWKRLRPMLMLTFDFTSGILRMPFELYQTKKINQTIYVKSSRSKNLSSKKGRKKNDIINKSGVDDIQIDTSVDGDNYIPIHMAGSRKSVREAIELIQEVVGKEHISTTKPSNTASDQVSSASTVSRLQNQDKNVPVELKTTGLLDASNASEPLDKGGDERNDTPESPVQPGAINDSGNKLAKEATAVESPPVIAVPKEEDVPSEIGIDSSQGMTRETITEASISSFNDRSNTSKAYSNFTLNENDPLLIFLRSQESCIKGSVDEFYTWLVKSEDIDSMMALKEAVNEDDYLNDMKVGDGGGSGIKGFKRKAFLRAISEYFNDESDTKSTVEIHQSLPQCQKKNPSEIEPPEELVCPISLNLMTNDPVVAADGITYERASIEDWFEKSKAKISEAEENLKLNPHSEADQRVVDNGICSPVYGSKMESLSLMPNTIVRNMAREKERNKNS